MEHHGPTMETPWSTMADHGDAIEMPWGHHVPTVMAPWTPHAGTRSASWWRRGDNNRGAMDTQLIYQIHRWCDTGAYQVEIAIEAS